MLCFKYEDGKENSTGFRHLKDEIEPHGCGTFLAITSYLPYQKLNHPCQLLANEREPTDLGTKLLEQINELVYKPMYEEEPEAEEEMRLSPK